MVVMQITHRILPEHTELYLEATLTNAYATRKEPGNIRFDVLRDVQDPCCFQLYEAYVDREAQQAHLASAHFLLWKESVQHAFANRSINRFEALHVP